MLGSSSDGLVLFFGWKGGSNRKGLSFNPFEPNKHRDAVTNGEKKGTKLKERNKGGIK